MSTQDTTDQSFKRSKAWSKAIFRSHKAPKAGTPGTTSISPTPRSSTPSTSEHSKKPHGHHSSLLTACIAVFRPHHTSSKPGRETEVEDEIEDGGAQEQEQLPATKSIGSSPSSSFSSDYFSTRIQELIERRTEFATELEAEIAASKDHWSELRPSTRVSETGELEAGETDEEVFRSLKQWPIFRWGDPDNLDVGTKLAEGAQAEVFEGRWRNPDGSETPPWVLKVYKEGSSLRDLQRQWPRGIFEGGGQQYGGVHVCSIFGGLLLNDGR